jgi:hypothetical protein
VAVSNVPVSVAVCVDPFLLRSTLHAALAADGRFTSYLCPVDEDPSSWGPASGARVLLASEPVAGHDLCVVLSSVAGGTVTASCSGPGTTLDCVDMATLRNYLIEHAALFERDVAVAD